MNECIKIIKNRYSLRNSPPYSANKCKTMKKKGMMENITYLNLIKMEFINGFLLLIKKHLKIKRQKKIY
jgi:hypothetical protein